MGLNIDTRWFQDRLSDRGVSQRKLARVLGLDPAAVSLMLHGRRKFTAREAVDVAGVLAVEVDEVLRHAGVKRGVVAGGGGAGGAATGEGGAEGDGGGEVEVAPGGYLEVPVPLAGGGGARVVLPRRLLREDAERIAAIVRAFASGD